ncbi:MAG: hypothetical protein M1822_010014 [Bathelium mastoideum]|nr:MAG: hypothetical protein M1822_010014 [Bathelium mastoideum]
MAEEGSIPQSGPRMDHHSKHASDNFASSATNNGQDQGLSKPEQGVTVDATVASSDITSQTFDHLETKNILRKIDVRIIPVLAILYLLSFLDRTNIANAKIEGLSEDLGLTGAQYNWALTAYFFTYCAFEVPSNMMLRKVGPSIWLPTIMVAWGVITTLMGIVQNHKGLLATRLFLGVAEAGLFPGVSYYLTTWYTRYDVQLRQAIFCSAATIAGAFSGLLAGISFMDGVAGLAGWRWIFILEGILTVLVALGSYFFVHDFPETARFLTKEEQAFVVHRLKYDGDDRRSGNPQRIEQNNEIDWKYVKMAFRDWQIWLNILVYWGFNCPVYAVALFLPTIIKELGYQSTTAQLLTVPIYVAAAISTVLVAWAADRKRIRSPFVITALFIGLIGFVLCISTGQAGITYAGVFIVACATYPLLPTVIAWLSNNLAGSYKRAIGMGIQISVGNLAGAATSNFYRTEDAPRFILGHGLEIGFISLGIIAAFILIFSYRRVNVKREKQVANDEDNSYTPEQLSELGDKAITFRYTL